MKYLCVIVIALLHLTGLLGVALVIWVFIKVVKYLALGVTI